MALSVSNAWKAACLRTGAELRHKVEIYDSSGLRWTIVDGLVSEVASVAIISTSTVAAEFDPETRQSAISRITIEVLDRWIRPIHSTERLKGMKVVISLGERSLTLANYETYFTGFIDDVVPQSDGRRVLIECLDVWSVVKDQKIRGAWSDMHPLEGIEDIYENHMGFSSSFYDATSLDPSDSANAGNSHLAVHRASVRHAPWIPDLSVHGPLSGKDLVRELLEIVDGVQVPDEDGKLTVKIFDAAAAAVAHWDEDEISELEQLEDYANLVNEVSIKCAADKYYRQADTDSQSNFAHGIVTSHIAGKDIDNKWIQQGQANLGVSAHARSGISAGAIEIYMSPHAASLCGHRDSCEAPGYTWSGQPSDAQPFSHIKDAQDETNYDNSPTTEGTFFGGIGHVVTDVITLDDGTTVTVDARDGTGKVTQFTVDNSGADGSTPAGHQVDQASTTGLGTGFYLVPDTDNVTETRPLYFQLFHPTSAETEIIKVTTQPTSGYRKVLAYIDPFYSYPTFEYSRHMYASKYKVQRGQLGTSAQAFPSACPIIDITAQVFMADHILNRYGGDAAPKIRVRTSLRQFPVALADLVTIDWSRYLGYGLDGIDNTTKWQVLSKAVEKDANPPYIEWTLLRAVAGTSTRTHNTWRNQMVDGQTADDMAKVLVGDGLGRVRAIDAPGLGNQRVSVTHVSGFNVKLNGGLLMDLTRTVHVHEVSSEALSASRDFYIYVDSLRSDWVIRDVALGAARPDQEPEDVPIAKVVTDGSTVSSITDLTTESEGTCGSDILSWENLSTDDVPNGNFGDW